MKKTAMFVILLLTLAAMPARADVAALSYPDPGGAMQTVAPSKQYLNLAGPLSLYLTAGLDRKVGYVITDTAGQVVTEGVSDLITPSDILTVLGQTYYGKVLTVPETLAEGHYTLAALILTGGGAEVSRQSVPLVVDRTGPTVGKMYYNKSLLSDNRLIGNHANNFITVDNIGDLSGIESVTFESYDPSTGEIFCSKPAWYSSADNTVGIGNGTHNSAGQYPGYLPVRDGPLGWRFIVKDKCGNETRISRVIRYNGMPGPFPELVAVYNPDNTTEFIPGSGLVGYEAYTPGMTTYANPVKLLYRLLRSNWVGENPDYGISAPTVVHIDANYVYCLFTVPFIQPFINSHEYVFSSPGTSANEYYVTYNLKLADSAPKSPVLISQEIYRDDTGWDGPVNGRTLVREYTTPVNVSKIRCVVEPRPYRGLLTKRNL